MSWQAKITAFDHVVYRLTQWYSEQKGPWETSNDLSKLKLTKLLFFVTAVTAAPGTPGLLTTFDDFSALPYGHVESSIQDHMLDSNFFNITRGGLKYLNGVLEYNPEHLADMVLRQQIDDAVTSLKAKNPQLINMTAFNLVDLSHQWQSWKTMFSIARQGGKLSMPIPVEMIMSEPKFFS